MNEFKINTLLKNYKFPDEDLDCYNSPKEGDLFNGGQYNLNNFSDRYITAIINGYIFVSDFHSGWFKIEDINNKVISKIKLNEFPEIEELLNESKKITNT
jgi:hypothetical protein